MQFSETLLLIFLVINLVRSIIEKKPNRYIAIIGLVLFIFHAVLGEFRWQMLFAYVVFAFTISAQFFQFKMAKWLRVLGFVFGTILIILSTVLTYVLPVFSVAKPTGAYSVASRYIYLKDETREEDITVISNDKRELMIKVWYPSSAKNDQPEKYLESVEREGFALKYGLPSNAFAYLKGVDTNTFPNLTPAKGIFPVLIFSPGYYTPASGYYTILEELVSHGFIIFNINHTYETMGTEFPDGRKVFFDNEYSTTTAWSDEMGKAVEQYGNAQKKTEKRLATKTMVDVYDGSVKVKRWAADIQSLLNNLEMWNQEQTFFLTEQLDLNRLGAFGHSQGGAAAIEASLFDERIAAAVNLDGAQWGSLIDTLLQKPSALISSEMITTQLDVNQYIFNNSGQQPFYNIILQNAGHSSFSDIPQIIRIPQLNEAGTISPALANQTIHEFLLAFFQKHLLAKEVDLETIISNNPNLKRRE